MLLERFLAFIHQEKLFQPSGRLLLAVSGGVDSVVMSTLCKQAGFDFTIAHCNFMLRGEESLRDEQFVRSLAASLEVPVLVKTFDTAAYATQNKLSVQAAARQLRYQWFYQLAGAEFHTANPGMPAPGSGSMQLAEVKDESGATFAEPASFAPGKAPQYILTAHHLDDSIETMLMNFFKGTGISGMRGILPRSGPLIRPLLFAGKAELLAFATENNLQFMEDSSNASDKYTRNYFRNALIPALQKVYPQAESNLAGNLLRFREAEHLYVQAIDVHRKKLLEYKGEEVHIPVLKLRKTVPLETVLFEIIKPYGFTPAQVTEVMHLLDSQSGKLVQSARYRIIRNRNWMIITPVSTGASRNIVIGTGDQSIVLNEGTLEFREMPISKCHINPSPAIAQLDASAATFPMLLRRPAKGDYFYPLGMQKKKKLSRFLSDLKLSVSDKEQTWVLEHDKKIIWVAGRRIDDRFKITSRTSRVLEIRLVTAGSG